MARIPAQSSLQQPSAGDVVADKYLIERVLGAGAMGIVYAARHLLTEKRCALKWLHPERSEPSARARFQQEARAAGRIHHANVIAIYDVGEHHGAPFFVMEWLEGESLQQRLQCGPLPVAEAVDLIAQAARGVAAAHEARVIHRDLKPDNLFITRSTRQTALLKVLDFGISKLDGDDATMSLTRSGTMVGTPLYMAPERLYAEPSDARADVFSLGVILYECLTCQLPHPAENAAALGRRFAERTQVTRPSTLRAEVPAALDAIILQALALSADKRTPTAKAFAEQLEAFSDSQQGKVAPHAAADAQRQLSAPAVATTVDVAPSPSRDTPANLPASAVAAGAVAASAAHVRAPVRPRARMLVGVLLIAGVAGLFALYRELTAAPSRPLQDARAAVAPSVTRAEKPVAPKPRSMMEPSTTQASVPRDAEDGAIARPSAANVETSKTIVSVPARSSARGRKVNGKVAEPTGSELPSAQPPQALPKELGRSKAHFETNDFYDR